MPTFAEEFQAQLVMYLNKPEVKEKIRIALAGQVGKLNRLFEDIPLSDDVKQMAFDEANKAGSKGIRGLLIEMVTQASSTLLSSDKMDLSDDIKPFFDLAGQNKDIVIDNLLQGIAVLYTINFDEIFNKKAGFSLVENPQDKGKMTISSLTEDGRPTPEQDALRDAYIANVIKPIQSVMSEITKNNVLLNSSESMWSKIKNTIFSIFGDESKSLKNRTDNLIKVAEITATSLNAYIDDISKSETSRNAVKLAVKTINNKIDRLYEIQEKMAVDGPGNYKIALETLCHELAESIHTHLLPVDKKEKLPLYQQILNKIRELIAPPKKDIQEITKKLISSDPVLKEKVALLKSQNQGIKTSKTAEPEKPIEQKYKL